MFVFSFAPYPLIIQREFDRRGTFVCSVGMSAGKGIYFNTKPADWQVLALIIKERLLTYSILFFRAAAIFFMNESVESGSFFCRSASFQSNVFRTQTRISRTPAARGIFFIPSSSP